MDFASLSLSRRRKIEFSLPSIVPFLLSASDIIELFKGLPGMIGLPWWGWLLIAIGWVFFVWLVPTKNDADANPVANASADRHSRAAAPVGEGNFVDQSHHETHVHNYPTPPADGHGGIFIGENASNILTGKNLFGGTASITDLGKDNIHVGNEFGVTPALAKPDFRVSIDKLTIDGSDGNPMVAVIVTVTNYGSPAPIDRWQLMYWHNGKLKEAGEQKLQDRGWMLEINPLDSRQLIRCGHDDYIGLQTQQPIATREPRKGFFYAELTGSAGISRSDLRTIYMQYQAGNDTFKSPTAGGNLSDGTIRLVNE